MPLVPSTRLLSWLVAVFLCACAGPEPENNGLAEDADPFTVRFELRNATATTAYVAVDCQPQWFRLAEPGGDPIRTSKGCSCACDDSECVGCGACAPPSVLAIEPGGVLDREWSGGFWTPDTDTSGVACVRENRHASGDFVASFCFGWTPGPNDPEVGTALSDQQCEPAPFSLEVDELVVHEIVEAPTPR